MEVQFLSEAQPPHSTGALGPEPLPIASLSPRSPLRGLSAQGPVSSAPGAPTALVRKATPPSSLGRTMRPRPVGALLNAFLSPSTPRHPDKLCLHLLAHCHSLPSSRKPSLTCPSSLHRCVSTPDGEHCPKYGHAGCLVRGLAPRRRPHACSSECTRGVPGFLSLPSSVPFQPAHPPPGPQALPPNGPRPAHGGDPPQTQTPTGQPHPWVALPAWGRSSNT